MVATLYPCMPDVANDLVQLLKGDFRWHVSTCNKNGVLTIALSISIILKVCQSVHLKSCCSVVYGIEYLARILCLKYHE